MTSQFLSSRKKVVLFYLLFTAVAVAVYGLLREPSPALYYGVCVLAGIGVGYWALFVTIAAEQFGTNIRATVATTVPNFVRGAVVPLTLSFQALKGAYGILGSAMIVGASSLLIALLALWRMEETYGRDLNFTEN